MKIPMKKSQSKAEHHYIIAQVAQRCQLSHYEYENGVFTLYKSISDEKEKGYQLDRYLIDSIICNMNGVNPAIDYISEIISENLLVG